MNGKEFKAELKISKDVANRINRLLDIDDFEENQEILEELGFKEDSIAFSRIVPVKDFKLELCVYTGQTNAWIELIVINPQNDVSDSEPIFGEIEGVYEADMDGNYFTLEVSIEE